MSEARVNVRYWAKADMPMAPNVRFGFKADIALVSLSLRPVLAQSRHRSETDKCMLLAVADIGASRSGSRSVATEVPNAKLLEKKMVRVGWARPVILTGSTKRRTSSLFELFQLEHVKSTEG